MVVIMDVLVSAVQRFRCGMMQIEEAAIDAYVMKLK